MSWRVIANTPAAADDGSTLIVCGTHDPAVAVLMALLRELGWPAHGVSFPSWSDEALASAIEAGDQAGQRAIVDQRYHQGPRWQLRASAADESFAAVLPRLHQQRYLVVIDDRQLDGEPRSWPLPAWLAEAIDADAAVMAVGVNAALECGIALVEALAGFIGQQDEHRLGCARSWQRLYQNFPELPSCQFKTNGTIDQVVPRGGGGWVYIEGVEAAVDIEIQVGGRSMIVTADQLRPDLLARGFHPTGLCGFAFTCKQKLNVGDNLHARVIGDSHELINSPAEVQAPASKGKKQPPPAALLGESKLSVDAPQLDLLTLPRIKPRPSSRVFASSLYAFLMREIRSRFGTQRGGYLWGFVEPAFQVIILTMLVRGIKGRFEGKIYGEDLVFFFSLGVIPYQMFSHAMSGSGIMAGSGLFNFRQIRPIDIGLVRGFIDFLTYGVIFALMLAISNWFGYDYTVDKPLEFLYCIFLLFWLAFSLGLFFDVMGSIFRQAKMVQQVFVRSMYLTSGVIYSIDSLPSVIKPYLLWNPMLHIIDEIRATCMEGYPARGDLNYAAACILLLMFMSLAFYRRNLYRLF
ncbi:ABC transporter permease [Hydrocarboniphaga sp.]|uniref:ABC transporter permease n=1 Tax=Hydrocarboniphaga sp. TaxID=2033016 RepID=UPI003D0A76A6